MKKILIIFFIYFLNSNLMADEEVLLKSVNSWKMIARENGNSLMNALSKKAKAILVIPDVTKIGFVLGGLHGKGVMISKNNNIWDNLTSISISGGSIGLQIGYENNQMVLFIFKDSLINDIKTNKITLGVDASFAFGDTSGKFSRLTDIKFTKDIYIYTDNSGFFAGASLSGAVITNNQVKYENSSYAASELLKTINN